MGYAVGVPDFATAFDAALAEMHDEGLNWAAFVPAREGPAAAASLGERPGAGLLLWLNLGPQFVGEALRVEPGEHPVDRASSRRADVLVRDLLRTHDPEARRVYPDGPPLDLRRWLAAARAQYTSPLGTGIRPDSGPWLAVRAAVWTRLPDAAIAVLRRRYPPLEEADSPCDRCETAACVTACPVGSVHPSRAPEARDLEACIDHRLAPDSPCAERCLARLACPVGTAHRYPEAQVRYHYRASLVTLRRWYRGPG